MNVSTSLDMLTNISILPLEELLGAKTSQLLRSAAASMGLVPEEELSVLASAVHCLQPVSTLEIGLASGSTALTIIATRSRQDTGAHIALDPNQTAAYDQRGLRLIETAGFLDKIRLIEQPSYIGMPALLAENKRFDFIYIDGNHMFDHTLLEWFYADKLMDVGGVIGFDDCNWPMVHAVMNFVQENCNYSIIKSNERTWFAVKVAEDTRPWFHYKPFIVPWGTHYEKMIQAVRRS